MIYYIEKSNVTTCIIQRLIYLRFRVLHVYDGYIMKISAIVIEPVKRKFSGSVRKRRVAGGPCCGKLGVAGRNTGGYSSCRGQDKRNGCSFKYIFVFFREIILMIMLMMIVVVVAVSIVLLSLFAKIASIGQRKIINARKCSKTIILWATKIVINARLAVVVTRMMIRSNRNATVLIMHNTMM